LTKTTKRAAQEAMESVRARLVGALRGLRVNGPASYPPTVARLLEVASVKPADFARLHAYGFALTAAWTPSTAWLARSPSAQAARAFFEEDLDEAIRAVVEDAIERTRASGSTVLDLNELTHPLAKPFAEAVHRRATQPTRSGWPIGVGVLVREGHPWLFRIQDVTPHFAHATKALPLAQEAPTADFEQAFDNAFARIDRAAGGKNYVLLLDLRRALADVDRQSFDLGLEALRRKARYSLDSADGRHERLPREALDAGVREGSSLLVYAARR
jgi:hypothetical protein